MLENKPNRELNYWLREGRSSNAELDFVIALASKIVPIEVKSGATGSLKSLHQFMGSKKAPFAIRFDTQRPGIQQVETIITINKERKPVKYPLISLPLYLVERLESIVSNLQNDRCLRCRAGQRIKATFSPRIYHPSRQNIDLLAMNDNISKDLHPSFVFGYRSRSPMAI